MSYLIVTHSFDGYPIGAQITDPSLMAAALSSHPTYVRQIGSATTTPTPSPTVATAATISNVPTTGTAGAALTGGTVVLIPAGSTAYAALYTVGADVGTRQAVTGSTIPSLTPASAGSVTLRIYATGTGGTALAESATITVAAATGGGGVTTPGGTTGPAGPAGPKGDPGAIGPAGPVGPAGAAGGGTGAGTVGPAGPQGPAGTAGAKGDTGAAGAIGPAGPAGPAGAAGTGTGGGATGPAGPQGPAGATGPAGAAASSVTIRTITAAGPVSVQPSDAGGFIIINKTTGEATTVYLLDGVRVQVVDGKGDLATNPITLTPPANGSVNGQPTIVMSSAYDALGVLSYGGGKFGLY